MIPLRTLGRVTLASLTLLCAALSACGTKRAAAPPPALPPPPPAQPKARAVSAIVLMNRCADMGPANAKLAEGAMYQLVEGCSTIAGGTAHFAATLHPGGRIELGPVPGQPETIPICVLKHALTHKVALQKPCTLDVRLEESSVAIQAVDAGKR